MPTKRHLPAETLVSPSTKKKEKESASIKKPTDGHESDVSMGEFEDAWEDEVESEEEVVINEDQDPDDELDGQDNDVMMQVEDDEQTSTPPAEEHKVYLPGQPMEKEEVLVHDPSTYIMLHSLNVRWPCLSFDIIQDSLGNDRTTFPATVYLLAGTQADRPKNNELYVMKLSQLHKTLKDADDSDDDDDEDLDEDPILEHKSLKLKAGVNRIRRMPHPTSHIAASWSDSGKVDIWNLTQHVQALDHPGTVIDDAHQKPISTVNVYKGVEGYAMDWSSTQEGRLLTGNRNHHIFLTEATSNTSFVTSPQSFQGHTGSIEDLQWSPNEAQVFSSCSCDGMIKIWDCRRKQKQSVLSIKASSVDVNVISWNKRVTNLLASGSDDGVVKVWDFRKVASQPQGNCDPFAEFKWHSLPITSLEWSPQDDSALAVAGADHQITLWDFSVEEDQEEQQQQKRMLDQVEVPSQLLFMHQGQQDVKEVHWHPQIPGMLISTAATGFNLFKTISF